VLDALARVHFSKIAVIT